MTFVHISMIGPDEAGLSVRGPKDRVVDLHGY